MICAYSINYLDVVSKNLAALFDIAINPEKLDADKFSIQFSNSNIAKGIEKGNPKYLAGMSASEMLSLILDKEVIYDCVPENRTKEYWAGFIIAKVQWKLDIPFLEIFEKFTLTKLISLYNPLHEADDNKVIEIIEKEIKKEGSRVKRLRKERKLTQEQLASITGINLRTIRLYEQSPDSIFKAQGDALYKLSKKLGCSIENLIKYYDE